MAKPPIPPKRPAPAIRKNVAAVVPGPPLPGQVTPAPAPAVPRGKPAPTKGKNRLVGKLAAAIARRNDR